MNQDVTVDAATSANGTEQSLPTSVGSKSPCQLLALSRRPHTGTLAPSVDLDFSLLWTGGFPTCPSTSPHHRLLASNDKQCSNLMYEGGMSSLRMNSRQVSLLSLSTVVQYSFTLSRDCSWVSTQISTPGAATRPSQSVRMSQRGKPASACAAPHIPISKINRPARILFPPTKMAPIIRRSHRGESRRACGFITGTVIASSGCTAPLL